MSSSKLYPKTIKGKLYRYRSIVGYFFLLLLFTAPFLRINGEQLLLLNILERKFVFFGIILWPQDFYLFVLVLLTFIVSIVLFTVVFGRVFCGWACPQTVFTEMIFRKLENWLEGNSQAQIKLDQSSWSLKKLGIKATKHALFLIISFIIANVFLSYVIGTAQLIQIITEPVAMHSSGLLAISVFTLVFYLVFSRMRELVCTVACPYGRLQGVLLDDTSIIIAYDKNRGEPRGKISRVPVPSIGDCVDCKLCVQVCPTGIDIRNGTQMECINCTACIDACDSVMLKTHRQPRLIGFRAEGQTDSTPAFKMNKRIAAYLSVVIVLAGTLIYLLASRTITQTTLLRAGGTLYQLQDENHTVSNLYVATLMNKSTAPINFKIVPDQHAAQLKFIQQESHLGAGKSVTLTFFVIFPQKAIQQSKTKIAFKVTDGTQVLERLQTTFIAPIN